MNRGIIKFFRSNSFFDTWLTVTLAYSLLIVTLDFHNVPVIDFSNFDKVFFNWLLISSLSGVIIYYLILNKWIFTFLFPLFFIGSATLAYYIFQFNIEFDAGVLESAFFTNSSESFTLISLKFVLYIILIITVCFFIIRKRYRVNNNKRSFLFKIYSIAGVFLILILMITDSKYIIHKVPFSLYTGVEDYMQNKLVLGGNSKFIWEESECKADSLTIVFILGESMRADHLNFNGYERQTFPEMAKTSVLSFDRIISEWTYTLRSVPQILTRSDSTNHSPSFFEKSFISIFDKNSFKTWWIGNQNLSEALLPFAKECDSYIYKNAPEKLHDFNGKYDAEMLPFISKAIESDTERKLIVVQQMGCHWWYPANIPADFVRFKPSLTKKSFNNSDKQLIINSYDNIALYTDHFLSEIVKKLEGENAIMVYLSDHGELLGENYKWLHSQNTVYEKNPACLIWFSERYKKRYPEKVKSAEMNIHTRYRTDFLFHSILDAGEIETPYLDYSLSIFRKNNE